MKKVKIKIGFCVAYDWDLLSHSVPLIYKEADLICFSIDKNRRSWAGKTYAFDDASFKKFLDEIDIENKIILHEDNFFVPELSPMQNEVRQRNMLAEFMGKGGWHVQLDTDEYFINFKGFVNYLSHLKPQRRVNICCLFITLFKQNNDGFFIINSQQTLQSDFFPVATNEPLYEFGRKNGYFNLKTNFFIVHQSWARSESEILQKIENWGHKSDFDVLAYFQLWKGLSKENYKMFKNFHPIVPENWEGLQFHSANSISELIADLQLQPLYKISKFYLFSENSIWLSRLRSLLKKRANAL